MSGDSFEITRCSDFEYNGSGAVEISGVGYFIYAKVESNKLKMISKKESGNTAIIWTLTQQMCPDVFYQKVMAAEAPEGGMSATPYK